MTNMAKMRLKKEVWVGGRDRLHIPTRIMETTLFLHRKEGLTLADFQTLLKYLSSFLDFVRLLEEEANNKKDRCMKSILRSMRQSKASKNKPLSMVNREK